MSQENSNKAKKQISIGKAVIIAIVTFILGLACVLVYFNVVQPAMDRSEAVSAYNAHDWKTFGLEQDEFVNEYLLNKKEYDIDPQKFNSDYECNGLKDYYDQLYNNLAEYKDIPHDDKVEL
ncbi:MAG: hypothetical protein MJ189_00895 [Coriobacteriales bacterium]|nr:hypothetical protein [Coriobacteriales bacterium]